MKDSEIAGILLGAVAAFVLIAVLFYIIISYILWRRKPETDRKKHCLNCLFKFCVKKRKLINNNQSKDRENVNGVTASYVNNSFTSIEDEVVIKTESVTLEVPCSPIRKSAEAYSIVDLNEDG